MGGAMGEAFVNTLAGSGMPPVDVLAREAIQNSVDAWRESLRPKPRVVFRQESLTGAEKAAFVAALGLSPAFTDRTPLLNLDGGNCLNALSDPNASIQLLFIDDYGTHGLYGDPHSPDSHLYRLLLSLGDGAKARASGHSGGSYGYGKAVYSSNSHIRTIVAYSALARRLRHADDPDTRLMGCSYFTNHQIRGVHYTGLAWFGTPDPRDDQIVSPLEDAAADGLARELGFSVRSADQPGTSILIVDTGIDRDELKQAVELWWWPRLLNPKGLDVEIKSAESSMTPRPKSREDLKPFLRCMDLLEGKTKPIANVDYSNYMNKFEKKYELGDLAFTALSDDQQLAVPEDRQNRVALIRNPLMVVSYEALGRVDTPSVGVFVAADDVDDILRMAEPAAHDRWDARSNRLAQWPDPLEAREVVESIVRRLKQHFKKFANQAVPPPSLGQPTLKHLGRTLAKWLSPSGHNGLRPTNTTEPISIVFPQRPWIVVTDDAVMTKGKVRIALKDGSPGSSLACEFSLHCLPIEEGRSVTEDQIEVTIRDVRAGLPSEPASGAMDLTLNKGEPLTFEFVTSPYNPDWSVEVRPVVERKEAADGVGGTD